MQRFQTNGYWSTCLALCVQLQRATLHITLHCILWLTTQRSALSAWMFEYVAASGALPCVKPSVHAWTCGKSACARYVPGVFVLLARWCVYNYKWLVSSKWQSSLRIGRYGRSRLPPNDIYLWFPIGSQCVPKRAREIACPLDACDGWMDGWMMIRRWWIGRVESDRGHAIKTQASDVIEEQRLTTSPENVIKKFKSVYI